MLESYQINAQDNQNDNKANPADTTILEHY